MPHLPTSATRGLLLALAAGLTACAQAIPHRVEPAPSTGNPPLTGLPPAQSSSSVANNAARLSVRAAATAPAAGAPSAAATPIRAAQPPAAKAVNQPARADDARSVAGMPLPNLPTLAAAPAAVAQPAQAAPAPTPAGDADSAQQARTELELAEQRTGLSADQEQRLDRAAMLIRSGDATAALANLRQLNGQLAGETRFYTVGRDENLRQIAARPEVYGNANLWPLLWRANQARLSQPQQIDQGLRLAVPAHPTVQEAAEAIAYAQSKAVEGTLAPGQSGPAH